MIEKYLEKRERIKYACVNHYYCHNKPILSHDEYDTLKECIEEEYPKHFQL